MKVNKKRKKKKFNYMNVKLVARVKGYYIMNANYNTGFNSIVFVLNEIKKN